MRKCIERWKKKGSITYTDGDVRLSSLKDGSQVNAHAIQSLSLAFVDAECPGQQQRDLATGSQLLARTFLRKLGFLDLDLLPIGKSAAREQMRKRQTLDKKRRTTSTAHLTIGKPVLSEKAVTTPLDPLTKVGMPPIPASMDLMRTTCELTLR